MALALYNPGAGFMQVSVTGDSCELMCRHCGARFLKHMRAARIPETLYNLALEAEKLGFAGMLVSGGSDPAGKVPLGGFLNTIRNIKKNTNLILNLHTGFVEEADIGALAGCGADVVSFDVVGSRRVLSEVYGLSLASDYFERTLNAFGEHGLRVVPHVTAGLDNGRDSGEEEALRVIARHAPAMVIINSLMPPPGRRLEGQRLEPVLAMARDILPEGVKLGIGCMRPRELAIPVEWFKVYGITSIAMPPRALVQELDKSGMIYKRKEGCCALEALL